MSDDSPTERIHEDILERARESKDAWINWAAATAAALAALAAISSALSNQNLTASSREQIKANDQWSLYQAKSIKAAVLRSKMETLAALDKPKADADDAKLHEYEHDLKDIQAEAKRLEEDSEKDLSRHEILEHGETLFHIAIAVVAIAVLSRQRWFWYLSIAAGLVGIAFLIQAHVAYG